MILRKFLMVLMELRIDYQLFGIMGLKRDYYHLMILLELLLLWQLKCMDFILKKVELLKDLTLILLYGMEIKKELFLRILIIIKLILMSMKY